MPGRGRASKAERGTLKTAPVTREASAALAKTGFSVMRKKIKSAWQQAFSKRLTHPRFQGTGWENLYATLSRATTTNARGGAPFWVGVELTNPSYGLGYVGVLCADITSEVLHTRELQDHTRALDAIRNQWPDGQLRFLKDIHDLKDAARRSCVFGAVVDAASTAALSLAESLAKAITIGNERTVLRILSVITAPSSRRGSSRAGQLPPPPVPFDVLLRSRTTEPWFEHRDLAVMCAVQKAGLIGINFNDVCQIFMECKQTGDRCDYWVSRRPRPVGAKVFGVARGPGRAERAAKKAMREIAASFPVSQITSGIIDITGDVRLKETRVIMETIRAACRDEAPFVLGFDARGKGPLLKIGFIAVTGGPEVSVDDESPLLE